MKRLIKLFLAINLTLISWGSFAEDAELIDRVVALVDEDVVLASELVRRTNQVVDQIKARNQGLPPIDVLRDQILDRLVVESLQIQMAKRVGVRISDAELDATIQRIADQNKLSTTQLQKKTEDEGTPWALFREDVRREIMISRVQGGAVSRRIKVSDKEIDNLLAQVESQGANQMQYSIGHILLPLAEGASPEEINSIRTRAEKLISDLRAGANFEETAIAYSKGQNALQGGDLGWRSLSQLPSLFAGNIKNMKAGDISEPLRSGSGLHILKVKETKGGFQTHKVLQTHVRHILISPDAITDEKAALEEAKSLRKRILDGEKFDELAMEHSDDKGSGSLGGDLKWSEPGTFVPPFTEAMDKLAVGEISEPVKTQFGYHIIEVLGRRDQDQTEDKKRERAYRMLHNRKFEEESQLWIQEMKDQAYIKLLLEDA